MSKDLSFDLTLLGKVEHSLLPKLINHYDIYIQNSLIEGNPKAVLEAMSCGAVVLCRDSPGMSQLIENNVNGYLYDSFNFHKVISTLISNKDLHLIKENARKFIIDKYNYSEYLKSLNIIIQTSISD